MKNKTLYIVTATAIAVILIGQVMIYGVNPYHTVSSSWDNYDGTIGYEVESNTSSNYDSLLIDVGMHIPDELMIYKDKSYPSYFEDSYLENKTALVISELSLRNVYCSVVDADEIRIELQNDLVNGVTSKRLLIHAGVLPDTIYDGSSDSLILKWLEIGGVMYWTGYSLGVSISSEIGIYECPGGYGNEFLGIPDSDIRREQGSIYATQKARDYEIGEDMSIMYNDSTFGINTQNLTDYLSIGLTVSGYDSLVLSKCANGNGMIVVFGGKLGINTAPIVAQVIASKLTYMSTIVDHDSGKLFHSSETGTMNVDSTKYYVLYIYVGLPQIYARAFDY